VSYAIFYSRAAAKAFRGIHPQDRTRIKEAIEDLADDPRPSGCLQLTGGDGEYRIRVGEYRIVYDVIDAKIEILVLRIAHRREVYR